MTDCRSYKLTLLDQSRLVCVLALCILCVLVTALEEPGFRRDEARVNRGSHHDAHSTPLVLER